MVNGYVGTNEGLLIDSEPSFFTGKNGFDPNGTDLRQKYDFYVNSLDIDEKISKDTLI